MKLALEHNMPETNQPHNGRWQSKKQNMQNRNNTKSISVEWTMEVEVEHWVENCQLYDPNNLIESIMRAISIEAPTCRRVMPSKLVEFKRGLKKWLDVYKSAVVAAEVFAASAPKEDRLSHRLTRECHKNLVFLLKAGMRILKGLERKHPLEEAA
jgi:hypothetical protein